MIEKPNDYYHSNKKLKELSGKPNLEIKEMPENSLNKSNEFANFVKYLLDRKRNKND